MVVFYHRYYYLVAQQPPVGSVKSPIMRTTFIIVFAKLAGGPGDGRLHVPGGD